MSEQDDELLEVLELNKRLEAVGRAKDIWKPVPPAIAKRISSAVKSWGSHPRRDVYEETSRIIEGLEVLDPRPSDSKAFWGLVSAQIAKMEDYFASIMEKLPPTGAISEENTNSLARLVATQAMLGLVFTASCRRNIGSGTTAEAVSDMHNATKFFWSIHLMLSNETTAPLVAKALKSEENHKRSVTTKGENKRGQHRKWASLDFRLSRDNPHWGPTGRAQEIAEKMGCSPSRVLAVLKQLREEKSDTAADS